MQTTNEKNSFCAFVQQLDRKSVQKPKNMQTESRRHGLRWRPAADVRDAELRWAEPVPSWAERQLNSDERRQRRRMWVCRTLRQTKYHTHIQLFKSPKNCQRERERDYLTTLIMKCFNQRQLNHLNCPNSEQKN